MEIAGIDPELVARTERETTELLSALIRHRHEQPARQRDRGRRPFSTTTFAATA